MCGGEHPLQRLRTETSIGSVLSDSRETTMAGLTFLLLLPVSVGAMVLLSPEDESKLSKAARVITAAGDSSQGRRVFRDNDWDLQHVDLPDLSFLDNLPDLQLVSSTPRDTEDAVTEDMGVSDDAELGVLGGLDDSALPAAPVRLPSEAQLEELYRNVAGLYNTQQSEDEGKTDSWNGGEDGEDEWIDEDDGGDGEDDDDVEEMEESDDVDSNMLYGQNLVVKDVDDDEDNAIDDEIVVVQDLDNGQEASYNQGRPQKMTDFPYGGYDDWNQGIGYPSEVQRPLQRKRRATRWRQPSPSTRTRERSRERGRKRSRDIRRRGRIANLKRSGRSRVEAKVEVLVVVENSIYRNFLASNMNNHKAALARIRRYYGIVFAMMDQRFQTIDHSRLSITVKISGILIAESFSYSPNLSVLHIIPFSCSRAARTHGWLEKLVDWSSSREHGRASVNTDKALHEFSMWIKQHHTELPKFDHAMVFSGYRLTNSRGFSFGGKAYLNAICDVANGNSVSIVADSGDFQCVKVAAHELAHSLGSVHDGDPGVEQCPKDGNYVMAPVASHEPEKLKYAFYFSPCSIQQMRKLLRTKKASCVRDEPTVFYNYDMTRLPPGQVISLDQHCQLIYGKKSMFCTEPDVMKMMCGQLWCRDPQLGNACRTNSYLTALPGTKCGDGKSCHLGECLSDAAVQAASQATQRTHTDSASPASQSPSRSTSASSSARKVVAAGSSGQSKLAGGGSDLENMIPTLPRSVIRGRVGRPDRSRDRPTTATEVADRATAEQKQRQGDVRRTSLTSTLNTAVVLSHSTPGRANGEPSATTAAVPARLADELVICSK
ncbi:hypothetical protein BaRGS_00003236, partial [Batillaria attramentaria]